MNSGLKSGLLLLALAMVLLASSVAQETGSQTTAATDPNTPTPIRPKPKVSLLDVTRVSTEGAAKSAAVKTTEKAPAPETGNSSPDTNVTEFHPTRPEVSPTNNRATVTAEESKKQKRVHGSVSGSTAAGASGNAGASAEVGASSKHGKTHVYVRTDHSRNQTPQ